MSAVRRLAALLALLLPLAACGVPAQDEPHLVTLPRRALNGAPSASVTEPDGAVAQVLCLIRDTRIVRTVRRAGAALDPQRQLDLLVAGPLPAEQVQGLSTALAATALTVTRPRGGATATVAISEAGEGTGRSDEVLAYGQIVCTLTARPDIAAVTFQREGSPLKVPRGDGTLTGDPLSAADYRSLIEPS